jgi:hypothetical protein
MAEKKYRTFESFYPYYLSEHSNRICRRLHFIGSILIVITFAYVVLTRSWLSLLSLPVIGYGFGGSVTRFSRRTFRRLQLIRFTAFAHTGGWPKTS